MATGRTAGASLSIAEHAYRDSLHRRSHGAQWHEAPLEAHTVRDRGRAFPRSEPPTRRAGTAFVRVPIRNTQTHIERHSLHSALEVTHALDLVRGIVVALGDRRQTPLATWTYSQLTRISTFVQRVPCATTETMCDRAFAYGHLAHLWWQWGHFRGASLFFAHEAKLWRHPLLHPLADSRLRCALAWENCGDTRLEQDETHAAHFAYRTSLLLLLPDELAFPRVLQKSLFVTMPDGGVS